jgi:uncharacterized protein (DUF488 family)
MVIFTIRHSNQPIERFLELLSGRQIAVVADIRRFPSSRKHPHFNREQLEASLRAQHIGYEWIEQLGGRRPASKTGVSPNQAWRNESFRNYADYMSTPPFRQGIDELLAIAEQRTVALMCAEGLWWQCHRRLVSDFLVANGRAVEHILPDGRTVPHVLTPEARVTAGGVTYPPPKTLFDEDQSNDESRA